MARATGGRITCEVLNHIATLRQNAKGWTRELNIVRWDNGPARLDLREWSPDKERSSRGLTFSRKEAKELREYLEILNMDMIEEVPSNGNMQRIETSYAPGALKVVTQTETDAGVEDDEPPFDGTVIPVQTEQQEAV